MTVGDLLAILRLRDEMSAGVENARRSVRGLAEDAGMTTYQLTLFGRGLRQAGTLVTSAFTAPIIAAGAAAIKFGGEFEAVMSKTSSIGGIAAEELENIKKAVLDLAPAVGVGPIELAEAMRSISSTVTDSKVALEILEVAAKGSAAGLGETNVVAKALTAVINSYGAENISAARAADILTRAIQDGGAEAKELAPVLANVVPYAAQLGVSLEEVGANIATITKLGVPTSEAVTSLVSVFAAMTRETSLGSKALASVNSSYAEMRAMIREKGLAASLLHLKELFEGNEKGLFNTLGRLEALKNVLATTGAQADVYVQEVERMKDSAGALDKAYDAATKTFQHMWKSVVVELEVVAVELSQHLFPIFKMVVQMIKEDFVPILRTLVQGFGDLPPWAQKATLFIIGFLALLGPGIIVIGQFVMAVGNIARAFGLLTVSEAAGGLGSLKAFLTGGALTTGAAAFVYLATAIAAVWAAWKIGNTETVKNAIATWALASHDSAAALYRQILGIERMTYADARAAVQATASAEAERERASSIKQTLDNIKHLNAPMAAHVKNVKEQTEAERKAAAEEAKRREEQLRRAKAEKEAREEAEKAAEAHRKAVKEAKANIADLTRELKPLNDEQLKTISHLHSLGAKTKDIALSMGIGEREVKKYTDSLDDMNDAIKKIKIEPLRTMPGIDVSDSIHEFVKAKEKQRQILTEFEAKNRQIRMDSTARELDQIAMEEAAELASLFKIQGVQDSVRKDAEAAIQRFYQFQRDIVNNTEETLVFRAREAGFLTREEHRKNYENARILYEQMKARSSEFNKEDIENAKKRAEELERIWKGQQDKFGQFMDAMKKIGLQFANDIANALAEGILTGDWSQLENNLKKALASAMGAAVGAALDLVVPGLGTALTPLFTALSDKLLGFLGLGTRGRDMVKEFAATFEGGFDGLQAELAGLGAEGARLWRNLTQGVGRDNPEQAQAAIDAVTKALERAREVTEKYNVTWENLGVQQRIHAVSVAAKELIEDFRVLTQSLGVSAPDAAKLMADELNEFINNAIRAGVQIPAAMQPIIESLIRQGLLTEENARLMLGLADSSVPSLADIKDAADRYGLSLDALGPKVQQLQIDEAARQIVKDFEILTAAGGDVGVILDAMGGKIREITDKALRFGLEIPEALRPVIQAWVDSGLAVDENGEKLTDLSRFNFAQPIAEKIDELIDSLKEFIDVIKNGAIPALGDLGRTRVDPIRIPYRFERDGSDLPSAEGDEGRLPGFAHGTNGYMNFGAGTTVRLHGWEKVTPMGQEETAAPTQIVDARTYQMDLHFHSAIADVDNVRRFIDEQAFPRIVEIIENGGAPQTKIQEALQIKK